MSRPPDPDSRWAEEGWLLGCFVVGTLLLLAGGLLLWWLGS